MSSNAAAMHPLSAIMQPSARHRADARRAQIHGVRPGKTSHLIAQIAALGRATEQPGPTVPKSMLMPLGRPTTLLTITACLRDAGLHPLIDSRPASTRCMPIGL